MNGVARTAGSITKLCRAWRSKGKCKQKDSSIEPVHALVLWSNPPVQLLAQILAPACKLTGDVNPPMHAPNLSVHRCLDKLKFPKQAVVLPGL